VYNTVEFIDEAVESLLGQTLRDFEFLIVDDGSSDGSLDRLRALEARDSRIRLFTQPNSGIAATRNRLLSMVQGKFIAIMDSDDISLPHRLETQVAFLNEHPEVVIVGGGIYLIDDKGRRIAPFLRPSDNETLQRHLLSGELLLPQPCAMIRKEAVDQVGAYDTEKIAADDVDFFLRLGEVGELANVPEVLLLYREHENSISNRANARQREEVREACERAWKRRGIQGHIPEQDATRGVGDRLTRHKHVRKRGWWAFNAGERKTARCYAARAVGLSPTDFNSWKLLLCAWLKPMPRSPQQLGPGPH
jgi:glycosyltransferase involved in cell wall biosynthesis